MWNATVQGLSTTASVAAVATGEPDYHQHQHHHQQDMISNVNDSAVVSSRSRTGSFTSNVDDDGASSIHPFTQVKFCLSLSLSV